MLNGPIDLLTYSLLSVALIASPGPNVLVILSTSLSHGRKRGFQTVLGTSAALLIQLAVAALATGWFVEALKTGFAWLKWTGVVYLGYLAVRAYLSALQPRQAPPVSSSSSFFRGFWTSLTNPKTIAFFAAFLPQFVDPQADYLSQIALLSCIFLGLAFVMDCAYVLGASLLGRLLRGNHSSRWQSILSGTVYLLAGAGLAYAGNA